ncbi:thioredoxin [Rhodobacterales bacterium]|nr:thioredoxin [Rhodobacterales bacterium]
MKIKCPDCSTSYEIKAEALGPEGRSVKCAKCGSRWFVSADEEESEPDFKAAADEPPDDAGPDPDENTLKDEAEWAADGDEPPAEEEDDIAADEDDDSSAFGRATGDAANEEDRFAAELSDDDDDDDEIKTDIETQAKRPKIIVNPDKFRQNHIGAVLNWMARRNFRRIGGMALCGLAIAICFSLVVMRDSVVKQSPDLASLFQLIGMDVNLRGLEFRNLRTFTEVEAGKQVLVVEGSIRNLEEARNSVPAVRLSIRNAGSQEIYAWTVEPRTKSLNALDETRFRTILADPPDDASDIQVRFVDRGQQQVVLE